MPRFNFCLGYFDVNDIDGIIQAFDQLDGNQFVVQCDNEICELIA